MLETTVNKLFRSVRVEQFPKGTVLDGQPVAELLYPDFEERPLSNGKTRKADIRLTTDENGVFWVYAGGGTSLFDRENVFSGKVWLSFEIPEGTIIPPSLMIVCTGHSKFFNANHYQIECKTKVMRMDAFKAALENLARNSIVRAIELAKSDSGK